ncbi:MAG: sigma-70 family RNA polymerase sigma factor [Ilumatobacteraceae bacterium]
MGTPQPTIDHGATLLEIYDRAVGEVFAYLRARCGGRAVAEDLTADTFLAAVGQIRRGGVEEVTIAWLIGIARHKLVDEWRRDARRPRPERLDDDSAAEHLAGPGDDVWDAIIDQHLVGDVMAELGPHHRSALALRYFDGLPVPEVAAHLGRTVEATETLLVRARRRFRTVYDRQQGGVS